MVKNPTVDGRSNLVEMNKTRKIVDQIIGSSCKRMLQGKILCSNNRINLKSLEEMYQFLSSNYYELCTKLKLTSLQKMN